MTVADCAGGPGRGEGLCVAGMYRRYELNGLLLRGVCATASCAVLLVGLRGSYGSICAVKCPVLCSAMRYDAQEQR